MKIKFTKFEPTILVRVSNGNNISSINGNVISFNEISLEFLKLIEDNDNLENVIDIISNEYDADKSVISNDLNKFINNLGQYGIKIKDDYVI